MKTTTNTRIAPSPTGNLHLGTVRTALYNILLAKKSGGSFLFRLEDTDRKRSTDEFKNEILDGFKWLGIDWDGDIVYQSQRNELHSSYVQKLLDEDKAYKCFADSTEGNEYVIRLRLGEPRDIKWQDLVRGEMSINSKDLGGDPVIQKYNGQVLYNFAVVVDDNEMNITHVLRGEDHLTNTAKQILTYEALGFKLPQFGHLPLIFTKDKQKLSKRKHGDIAGVAKYKDEGYLPEALVNYLIATSYTCPTQQEQEIYSLDEAAASFDVVGVSKSPAIYDLQKLNWYNREYMSRLDLDELKNFLQAFLNYDLESELGKEQVNELLDAIRGNLNKFADINAVVSYFFVEETIEAKLQKFIDQGQELLEELFTELNQDSVDFSNAVELKDIINKVGERRGLSGKNLFWPVRIAISYRTSGPDLGLIMKLLGRAKVINRLSKLIPAANA